MLFSKNPSKRVKPDGSNKLQLGKRKWKISTWNLKGLFTEQTEVLDGIKRLNMDIVILTETRKKDKGSE